MSKISIKFHVCTFLLWCSNAFCKRSLFNSIRGGKNGTIIYHDTFVYFIEMFLKLGTTSFYYSMLFILNILLNKYFNVLFVVVLFYVECEGLLLDEGKNFIALELNTITDGMSYSLKETTQRTCVCVCVIINHQALIPETMIGQITIIVGPETMSPLLNTLMQY